MAEKKMTKEEKHLKQIAEIEEKMQQRVKVRLYKDNYKSKDPVYVAVNAYSARIPRGIDVMIPRFAAEVLKESLAQDEQTFIKLEEMQDEYDRSIGAALS
ncbi:MAG: hypothetical protein IJD14_00645 [Christensenellaceae bacterium]|nr:hypothetical protein [Christensenellaceae bacterium]